MTSMTSRERVMCALNRQEPDRVPFLEPVIAENVALQIERRIAYRRAMKKAVQMAMDFGAEGIKIRSSGRLNGAEISRSEWYREGKIPLHTLRTPIDYGFAEANTVYGKIGVKCWICRKEERPVEVPAAPAAPPPQPAEV